MPRLVFVCVLSCHVFLCLLGKVHAPVRVGFKRLSTVLATVGVPCTLKRWCTSGNVLAYLFAICLSACLSICMACLVICTVYLSGLSGNLSICLVYMFAYVQ